MPRGLHGVFQYDEQLVHETLRMNEPFRWNTDTLSGSCKGMLFYLDTDALTPGDIDFIDVCGRTPLNFTVTGIRNSVVYMRLCFARGKKTFI